MRRRTEIRGEAVLPGTTLRLVRPLVDRIAARSTPAPAPRAVCGEAHPARELRLRPSRHTADVSRPSPLLLRMARVRPTLAPAPPRGGAW